MNHTQNKEALFRRYSLACFDESLTLRVPMTMWFIILYGLHPLPFSLLGFFPRGGQHMAFLRDYIGLVSLLGSFSALAFLLIYFKRKAEANAFWRFCWHHGAVLLFIPTVCFVAEAFSGAYHGSWAGVIREPSVVYHTIGLGLCGYWLFYSPRITDTLGDYPVADSVSAELNVPGGAKKKGPVGP